MGEGFGGKAFPSSPLGERLGMRATEGERFRLRRFIRLFVPHLLTVFPSVGGGAQFRRLSCGNGASGEGMNSPER